MQYLDALVRNHAGLAILPKSEGGSIQIFRGVRILAIWAAPR